MMRISVFRFRGSFSYTIQKCKFHSHNFTDNLQFISNSKLPKFKGFQAVNENDPNRPLILLYSWTQAKDKHVNKYAEFYLDRDFDVLKISTTAMDLLRPIKGAQVTAGNVLDFIHQNPHFYPMVVHGISVGAYVFTESMIKVKENMGIYGPVLKRFVGQIWDSPADVPQLPIGVSKAFTDNKRIQKSMQKYLVWFMNLNYKTATRYYIKANETMKENITRTPSLFIFSKTDPVSDESVNMPFVQKYESMGLEAYAKCFEDSPHVAHYRNHKSEYEETVTAFLEKIGVLHSQNKKAVVL
ncbi:UNVERIFIED_CONTAM: hypothetical protein RMT77_002576 [Armadillidium vulgare]